MPYILVVIIALAGALIDPQGKHPEYTNGVNAVVALNPITAGAFVAAVACKHITCTPADGAEHPQLNRDVYSN